MLTHAHPDHMGIAERVHVEGGARVLVHEDDAHYATSGEPIPSERRPAEYLELWPQAQRTFTLPSAGLRLTAAARGPCSASRHSGSCSTSASA